MLCIIWSWYLLFVLATVSVCSSLSNNSQKCKLRHLMTSDRSTHTHTHTLCNNVLRECFTPPISRPIKRTLSALIVLATSFLNCLPTKTHLPNTRRGPPTTRSQWTSCCDQLVTLLCHFPKTNFRNGRGELCNYIAHAHCLWQYLNIDLS